MSANPGQITSVATANGKAMNVARDLLANVYGSNALSSGGIKSEATGRTLVTRGAGGHPLPGWRYIAAMQGANTVFAAGRTSAYAAPPSITAGSVDKLQADPGAGPHPGKP